MTPADLAEIETCMTAQERAELHALLSVDAREVLWRPTPGPQQMAYESIADVVGYGGAAGSGKTDLAIGKALTQHRRVQVFRREGTELGGLIERMAEIVGHRDGLGGKPAVWRNPHGQCELVEFGSVPNAGDERKYQGRAKDLLVLDEAANFLESQVRFLMGWVRSVTPGQRCQTLMCFNPPTSSEGAWVREFFGPWIDPNHPRAAKSGELRFVAMVDGKERWVDGPEPFEHKGETIRPSSRTFVSARLRDNPHLRDSGYVATLQALPEPLRSQMLYGDFAAGMGDDPWQLIPSSWVKAAQARWTDRSPRGEMMQVGVDVARGGTDSTVIVSRHRTHDGQRWFSPLNELSGVDTDSGHKVAAQVMASRRDDAPVNLDLIGVGTSPTDILTGARVQTHGVNMGAKATASDRTRRLSFKNMRTQMWWLLRDALDPEADAGAAIPPCPKLAAELCAPRWKQLPGGEILVESREEIIDRIGRSPDRATALALANLDHPKKRDLVVRQAPTNHDPYDDRSTSYDPYA